MMTRGLKISQKITGLLVFYFLVALVAIGSTLYVSWKLEGGGAAINDAGKERMRSFHIAFLLSQQLLYPNMELRGNIQNEVSQFERTLTELKNGNPQRPLYLPKDPAVTRQIEALGRSWSDNIKPSIYGILDGRRADSEGMMQNYRMALEEFVVGIDTLVLMIESNNAHATSLLRSFQIALIVVALLGTVILDYIFSRLLVRPVQRLNNGLQSMGKADFAVRLPIVGHDELSELAQGFNQMAEKLQTTYDTLEERIADKTRRLEVKNRELGTLYEIATLLNSTSAAEPLYNNVLARMVELFGARGGVIRLTDPNGEQLQVVAARGMSEQFLASESYLALGNCLCGETAQDGLAISTDFDGQPHKQLLHTCKQEGFEAITAIPIRSQQHVLGLMNLFFDMTRILPPGEIRFLESVGLHLGTAIENRRLIAREKEMAISEERNLLAQELHDSIAQSLAFLNIQVQLLQQDLSCSKIQNAMDVLEQIREGVQESYDDVRELLVHFRTGFKHSDLDAAIASALEKFEAQIGIPAVYRKHGHTPDLAPEYVIQVLHILQESLSNIRKHAHATQIEVALSMDENECRLCVHDNGTGFDAGESAGDTHVGIRIMRERAHRMGAKLLLESAPGHGTQVRLIWPTPQINTKAA